MASRALAGMGQSRTAGKTTRYFLPA